MGKQSIFDKVREWLGGIAFDIFLWSARMTQDEYLDTVVRESGLTQRAPDAAKQSDEFDRVPDYLNELSRRSG
jgi:hypothetical protein